MRILFVTLRLPGHAMRGDQLRAFEQLRHLGTRHRITLLACDDVAADPAVYAQLADCCERVVLLRRNKLATWLRAGAGVFGTRPLQVAMFDQPALRREFTELITGTRFDLVHLQLARLGFLLDAVEDTPCVIDFVDALSLNMRRRARIERWPWRSLLNVEARRLECYEQALIQHAQAVAVCSQVDADALGAGQNVHLVRNGVDLERFAFRFNPVDAKRIVFVGNLGYFPNVDAVTWLVREVMPLVIAHCPAARLTLVGARPSPLISDLVRGRDDVQLIGDVDDVLPHLHAANVAVVPMRSGSGQQLKVIEAMAAGTAVVTTSISANGLDLKNEREVLIADDAATIAASILRLFGDVELRQSLATAARRRVEQDYGWARAADELDAIWQRAAMSRGASR